MSELVVIVGAGLTGLRTATELRERDYAGQVVVVGDERHAPYDRPPLSSELLARSDPVWLAEDLGTALTDVAEVVTGSATAFDRSGVHLHDGRVLAADDVVVATGSAPITRWPGALTLHRLDDAARLRAALTTPEQHLAIIGAGWIGVEVAGQAAAAGHRVTLLEAGPAPLADHLGPRAGEYTRRWHEQAGVELHTDTAVTDVEQEGSSAVVHTTMGDVRADVVLAAIGVRANTSWLTSSGVPLTLAGLIPTDVHGRAHWPDAPAAGPRLWAAGDVALRDHPRYGTTPGGHWFAALRDPAGIAAGITGAEPAPNLLAPEVFSDQFGHHIEMIGTLADEAVLRGDPNGPWTLLQVHEGRLIGAIMADSPRDTSAVRKALKRAGADFPTLDADLATDPAVPLRRVFG